MAAKTPLEQLARFSDQGAMLKKLRQLAPDRDDQAALLWEGARQGSLRVASGAALHILARAEAPYDAADLLAALAPGPLNASWSDPRWWALHNLHSPFKTVTALAAGLDDAGPLIDGLDRLDGLLRCAVEVGLAAEGFALTLSEGARADFLSWALLMSFPEEVEALGRAAFGEAWLVAQVDQLVHIDWVDPDIDWRPVSKPERFVEVWEALSPESAVELASRSYWDAISEPVALLERRADLPEAALLRAADQWLTRMGASGASYGGHGSVALFLTLHRRGLLERRHWPLLHTGMYSAADVPLLEEGIRALPLEERARRALQHGGVNWLYAAQAPTREVIDAGIGRVRAMKKRDRNPYALRQVRVAFRALGQAAAEPLIDALSAGPAAPLDDVLLELLGALQVPEAGPVFAAALSKKATRAAAVQGLVQLGEAAALPILEVELFAKKKDARVGAAQALAALPPSPARAELAARRLAKERAKDVIAALAPIA